MLDAPARRRPEFYLPAGETSHARTLPCGPGSVAVARRLVVAALARWGMSEDVAERVELIVSELATNALRHARTCGASIRVTVTRGEDEHVQVAVSDLDRRSVTRRPAGPYDEGGRGLDLVAALSVRWGCDYRHWGKRVWADLAA
ncbi:ATP-binding protein [Streptomyces hydrogenans]|uniref:ATP-binding protein n=1 Tax=Streptomyces hydrogenans TaxID=1873719 RepID=UPI0036C0DE4B